MKHQAMQRTCFNLFIFVQYSSFRHYSAMFAPRGPLQVIDVHGVRQRNHGTAKLQEAQYVLNNMEEYFAMPIQVSKPIASRGLPGSNH